MSPHPELYAETAHPKSTPSPNRAANPSSNLPSKDYTLPPDSMPDQTAPPTPPTYPYAEYGSPSPHNTPTPASNHQWKETGCSAVPLMHFQSPPNQPTKQPTRKPISSSWAKLLSISYLKPRCFSLRGWRGKSTLPTVSLKQTLELFRDRRLRLKDFRRARDL